MVLAGAMPVIEYVAKLTVTGAEGVDTVGAATTEPCVINGTLTVDDSMPELSRAVTRNALAPGMRVTVIV